MCERQQKSVVYFDGVCGLCNCFVNFLLKFDKKNRLLFSPIQGETFQEKNKLLHLPFSDSVVFEHKGKWYYKSEAALRIVYHLGGFWKVCIVLMIVPAFIRNFVYDIIARNRYAWFGKRDTCRMPTLEEQKKFLP